VAFSHHWALDKLLDPGRLPQTPAGGPGWLPHEWTVDLVKLCCLLRTLMPSNATTAGHLVSLPHFASGGVSDQHWKFQSLFTDTPLESGMDRIRFRSSHRSRRMSMNRGGLPSTGSDGDVSCALLMPFSLIQTENGLLRRRFNTDHPSRLALDLRTEGWEPANAEIRIAMSQDSSECWEQQLYGNRPEVPLRRTHSEFCRCYSGKTKIAGPR